MGIKRSSLRAQGSVIFKDLRNVERPKRGCGQSPHPVWRSPQFLVTKSLTLAGVTSWKGM